jgi:hypothetical protein
MRRRLARLAVGLVALAGAGCATSGQTATTQAPATPASTPKASEAEVRTLRERVAAFWVARMSDDDRGQWEMLEPRGRGRLTPREYASERRDVRYLGYQVEDAAVDGHFAVVKVRVLFRPIIQTMVDVSMQTVLLDDHWIRVNGSWYRQLDDRQPQRREP